MNKRHLQNCLSEEADSKKYKKLIESEDRVNSENVEIMQSVPIIVDPEFVASVNIESDPKSAQSKEELIEENINEVNANQCKTPKKTYTIHRVVNETLPASTSSVSKNDSKNEDVLDILRKILQSQHEINARLEKLEQNQAYIMENQSVLSNEQNTIVSDQQKIVTKLEKLKANTVSKSEMMAQSKMLMECKVVIKKIEKSVCHMTGEKPDKNLDEVDLETIEAVQGIEQKLETPAMNCLSKEKKIFEANVKKYKKIIENEDRVRCEKIQIESVPIIVEPEFVASVDIETDPLSTQSEEYVDNKQHILKDLNEEITPAINTNQSKTPKKTYTIHRVVNETLPASTSSASKKDSKNEDVLDILRKILQSQNEFNVRLEKLEQNQAYIMDNQSVLSNEQNSIESNQEEIATKLEEINDSIVTKAEMMAQSKMLKECKVVIRKIEKSVCHMTGETSDKNLDEVASILPLQTIEAVQEVEQKLETPEFAQAMRTYLHKLKGTSEDVNSVVRATFTDDLLEKYNWEGRWEKYALGKLILFNKTLREVFQHQGLDYERSVRKAVERSHHRMKQRKYLNKMN